jgi:hypothetical protein
VLISYGSISYLNAKAATPILSDDGRPLFSGQLVEAQTPVGPYLLLIAPFDDNGRSGEEQKTRSRISEVIGMLVALNGRNMAFEHIFDYEHVLGVNDAGKIERRVIGSVVHNPLALPRPDISDGRRQLLKAVDHAIAASPSPEAQRIGLALRWYQAAILEDGVDAFHKLWIAIETLAMPDNTNIKPINHALAKIYEIASDDAKSRFQVGRIFQLRVLVVHKGAQFSPRIGLLEYMRAIFEDLLFQAVGQASEHRIEHVLNDPKFPGLTAILTYPGVSPAQRLA